MSQEPSKRAPTCPEWTNAGIPGHGICRAGARENPSYADCRDCLGQAYMSRRPAPAGPRPRRGRCGKGAIDPAEYQRPEVLARAAELQSARARTAARSAAPTEARP